MRICDDSPGSAAKLVAGPGTGSAAVSASVQAWLPAMNRAMITKPAVSEVINTSAVHTEVRRDCLGT